LARDELLGGSADPDQPDDDGFGQYGSERYRELDFGPADPYGKFTHGYAAASEESSTVEEHAVDRSTVDDPDAPPDSPVAAMCRGVGKVYVTADEEVDALSNVDKDFPRAKVSTIVGPSGSGKSSLLRILACVDRPTSGSVRIAGTEVAGLGARGRRALRRTSVAYVFQNPMDNLVEYLDAAGQVKLAGRLRGTRPDAAEIEELLRTLGLEHRADHRPGQLSGGEQQRLAFACAVIGDPALVVADEPTAELDSASADRVLAAVHDLAQGGVAFILSSHDRRVMDAADHMLRLEHGRVVESW
jgi:putative ABC transport system ATP-binding protein